MEEQTKAEVLRYMAMPPAELNDEIAGAPYETLPKALRAAILALWACGARLEYRTNGVWLPKVDSDFNPNFAMSHLRFQLPPKLPVIDWRHVHTDFKFLTVDPEGRGWLWSAEPIAQTNYWVHAPFTTYIPASGFASYRPGTCAWTESLIERPHNL